MSEVSEERLSAAQRARLERNRQKAKALREARLVKPKEIIKKVVDKNINGIDSGAGFFIEEEEPEELKMSTQHAPIVDRTEQPNCLQCDKPIAQSYLLDTFDYPVCDNCKDSDGAHSLVTRTEAKSEFLLKDCDLDLRPPPLRCIRRRNPHRSRFTEMRLYLRPQVEERAREVWGSTAALEEERERHRERRERAERTRADRKLRALRMAVRSTLYDRTRVVHEHVFGPETYDADTDLYQRSCDCGHTETYEKM